MADEIDKIENILQECMPKLKNSKSPEFYPVYFIENVE